MRESTAGPSINPQVTSACLRQKSRHEFLDVSVSILTYLDLAKIEAWDIIRGVRALCS